MSYLNESATQEIRAEMARQKKTVKDLAKAIGVSNKTAYGRMSGVTPLSLDDVYSIASWLGVNPLQFIPDDTKTLSTEGVER